MHRFDIRTYKTNLRNKYKQIRINMDLDEKNKKDKNIKKKLVGLREYKDCDLLLTFMSTDIEVDTYGIIEYSWNNGKRVAVPRCVEGTRLMSFYEIHSFSQLEKHTFGVMEPDPSKCSLITDFDSSVCIVPGLVFDSMGYRLGYGKGYYDRFLSKYNGTKIGICYYDCLKYSLRRGKYDVVSDIIINDKYINFVSGRK